MLGIVVMMAKLRCTVSSTETFPYACNGQRLSVLTAIAYGCLPPSIIFHSYNASAGTMQRRCARAPRNIPDFAAASLRALIGRIGRFLRPIWQRPPFQQIEVTFGCLRVPPHHLRALRRRDVP
jgi:hypothetical protein